jgi:DNA-binding transcriptional ArsR family regulator
MTERAAVAIGSGGFERDSQDVWRALNNPLRRGILDLLREGPSTTGAIAAATPDVSRFAVMQHLAVLVEAGLVVVRRRGRYRYNHLNPVPLREWYERWVTPLADRTAGELTALRRHVESGRGGSDVAIALDEVRVVRLETELRFRATPERVFEALTERVREWFPHSYGDDRTEAIVIEPRVGGLHYEDWGEGAGHLYGNVTEFDPPRGFATRGRIMPGSILDTTYELEPAGEETILRVSKVAVGPMTDDEAAGVRQFGDISRFESALRAVIED